MLDGRVIGAIDLSFRQPRTFTEDDRTFLQTLAQQCAQALDRARLYAAEQEARERAEAAVRIRDQFLSIAAHELKTPLTSLLGYAQLFQRRMLREGTMLERDQRSLRVMVEQAQRLNRMVQALLDISRLELGQLTITREAVDIGVLVRRIVEENQHTLESRSLQLHAPDTPLIIQGDELRLEQVIQNLIQNALKYSAANAPITIIVEGNSPYVSIAVVDQGIGIPQNALPLLFQRFYRASNAEQRQISGIGVGLYVVREIVTMHGGEVSVESTEGQGSTFTVRLPLDPTQ
jgi:signal transduction histidine kinase